MRNKTCAVVVTYNRIELLKHCLEKIKLQTFNCDILVIDNNSNDGTHEYLVSKKIPFYKTEVNIGGAGGFNLGIKICVSKRYKYICYDKSGKQVKGSLYVLCQPFTFDNGKYSMILKSQ